MADWDAVDQQMRISSRTPIRPGMPGFIEARKQHLHGFPLVGDPDRVAAMLATLSEAGFDGVGLSFVNYLDELPYFRDEVLARLERMGLRENIALDV
jgi:alkanesulfonate monooxygenase SsuD/methylene tetrahydromethanopterin reductase-like flavin-dependent oxidoreductase (luciferase family)